MRGDFSRGFEPDHGRGRDYRRVLLQQNRLLLDSDWAALVDAHERALRGVATDLGCHAGSPDLGFLITPGRLRAVFDRPDRWTPSTTLEVVRDYRRKYLERFPSLRLRAGAGPGEVAIPLRGGLGAGTHRLALWMRADIDTTCEVEAGGGVSVPLSVPLAGDWQRLEVQVAGPADALTVRLTGDDVWLALVESDEAVNTAPFLWAETGRFYAAGLPVEIDHATGYPEVSFPAAAGFGTADPVVAGLAAGDRVFAYLETWERLVTHVEDRGIREEAIGGGLDTTVRSRAVGQVKLAAAGAASEAEIRAALTAVPPASGTLEIDIAELDETPDPCALPLAGGYTGQDHRLYRFEVHAGGGLGDAMLVWSRDNGSQLVALDEVTGSTVRVAREAGLADGDLVEVLSEVVELGDAAPAELAGGAFTPAQRQAGVLARLRDQGLDDRGRQLFGLVDVNDPSVAVVPAGERYAADGSRAVKLRVWHGLIRTEPAPGGAYERDVEAGIGIRLQGSFRVGDYWQYEARKGRANDTGAWVPTPHGPARRFAPLAVLRRPANNAQPMVLEAWLDARFSPLCALDADDVTYDGDRSRLPADTVQEAIDELHTRIESAGFEAIERVTVRIPGGGERALRDGDELRADELAEGLVLNASPNVDLTRVTPPGLTVTAELPFPETEDEHAHWGPQVIGHRPVSLAGQVEARADQAIWRPTSVAEHWLRRGTFRRVTGDLPWQFIGFTSSRWDTGVSGELRQHAPPVWEVMAAGPPVGGVAVREFEDVESTESVALAARWSDPFPPSTWRRTAGAIVRWHDRFNFSVVGYEERFEERISGIPTGTGSHITVPEFRLLRRLIVFDVHNGQLWFRGSQTLPATVTRDRERADAEHRSIFTLRVWRRGVEWRKPTSEDAALRAPHLMSIKAIAEGPAGVFVNGAAEFWRFERRSDEGAHLLLLPSWAPRRDERVLARLLLQRQDVRRLGTPDVPFERDYAMRLWLTLPPLYGYGAGDAFTGIGAELIQ